MRDRSIENTYAKIRQQWLKEAETKRKARRIFEGQDDCECGEENCTCEAEEIEDDEPVEEGEEVEDGDEIEEAEDLDDEEPVEEAEDFDDEEPVEEGEEVEDDEEPVEEGEEVEDDEDIVETLEKDLDDAGDEIEEEEDFEDDEPVEEAEDLDDEEPVEEGDEEEIDEPEFKESMRARLLRLEKEEKDEDKLTAFVNRLSRARLISALENLVKLSPNILKNKTFAKDDILRRILKDILAIGPARIKRDIGMTNIFTHGDVADVAPATAAAESRKAKRVLEAKKAAKGKNPAKGSINKKGKAKGMAPKTTAKPTPAGKKYAKKK